MIRRARRLPLRSRLSGALLPRKHAFRLGNDGQAQSQKAASAQARRCQAGLSSICRCVAKPGRHSAGAGTGLFTAWHNAIARRNALQRCRVLSPTMVAAVDLSASAAALPAARHGRGQIGYQGGSNGRQGRSQVVRLRPHLAAGTLGELNGRKSQGQAAGPRRAADPSSRQRHRERAHLGQRRQPV